MSPRKIIWSEEAFKDISGIIDYIMQSDSSGAERVYHRLMLKVRSLKSNPEMGRVIPELELLNITIFRELVEVPWRILYRSSKEAVYILAVFDGRRDLSDVMLRRLL